MELWILYLVITLQTSLIFYIYNKHLKWLQKTWRREVLDDLNNDKAILEIKKIIHDVSIEGEGVFSLRKLDEQDYFFRINQKDMFKRGHKR